jgi:hypothetical protein
MPRVVWYPVGPFAYISGRIAGRWADKFADLQRDFTSIFPNIFVHNTLIRGLFVNYGPAYARDY